MRRTTIALLAALEAFVMALVGFGVAFVPLVVLWAVHFGLGVDFSVFLRAAADVWLVGHGVDHAGGGGAAVLRVGRQHQHARGALCLHLVQHRGNGRVAITHRVAHQQRMPALAQVAQQALGLPLGPRLQG